MTSHDVVAIARRALGTKKVGHAGTLDPMATGVLVLGFGNGTRLLQYITDGQKKYEATLVLGVSTITDDAQGEILIQSDATAVTDLEIAEELQKMVGVIQQRPSSVSAVKVDGERAYTRVRAGEKFELAAREVKIDSIQVGEIRRANQKIEIEIKVICGPGTFIRAIARDCGDRLNVGGHLSQLRRTLVAPFDLSESTSVEALKSGDFSPIPIVQVAALTFAIREVTSDEERELSFGRSLTANQNEEISAALSAGRLLALLRNKDGRAYPIAVLANENVKE